MGLGEMELGRGRGTKDLAGRTALGERRRVDTGLPRESQGSAPPPQTAPCLGSVPPCASAGCRLD